MKNKTVKMVLAVVVLGVCCGAYACLLYTSPSPRDTR